MRSGTAAVLLAGGLGVGTACAAPLECTTHPQVQLDKIAARVIVVGEVHGTEQAPRFMAQLACGLLKQGRPVILALERDGAEQVSLNRYLDSAGQASDVQMLLGSAKRTWASPIQDGRNSQAILALIEQIRQWRQAGQRVGVLAMQLENHEIVPPSSQPPSATPADLARDALINDRAMADKVWLATLWYPAYTVVALAGNTHTTIGSKARAEFVESPSFADVLASYMPVHVIGLTSAGGTSWSRTPDGKSGPRTSIASPMFYMDSHVDSQAELGKITASPPANAAR